MHTDNAGSTGRVHLLLVTTLLAQTESARRKVFSYCVTGSVIASSAAKTSAGSARPVI
jgi:hypothetical protein